MPLKVVGQKANGRWCYGPASYDRVPNQTIIDFCNATGEPLDLVTVAIRAERSITETKLMKANNNQEFQMKIHHYKDFSPKELPSYPNPPDNWFRHFVENGGLLKDEAYVENLMKDEEFKRIYENCNKDVRQTPGTPSNNNISLALPYFEHVQNLTVDRLSM